MPSGRAAQLVTREIGSTVLKVYSLRACFPATRILLRLGAADTDMTIPNAAGSADR